jgi:fructan beta-fructosidase
MVVAFLMCICAHLQAAEDILVADFEGPDYQGWTVSGDAFGSAPAAGTLPGQMEVSGFKGRRLVNSFSGGDDTTGKLTSPEFTIQRQYINFLIGGGRHPGETCINLMVDGKTVCTATGPNGQPGGTEALDWSSWDVSKFKGQKAIIEIVDTRKGGWGHINIDHIVQSDNNFHVPVVDVQRIMTFTKKYLQLPVKHGAEKRLLRMRIGQELVREFVIEYAEAAPDYWVWLDVSPFHGNTATLTLAGIRGGQARALDTVFQADEIKEAKGFYKERLRPQFHFTSRRGWNNDSNGMVYYAGEYHLFYQHNPFGWAWGNMTWGHAVSTDMIHWQELDDAIHPDALGTIFSGSAVIDRENTTGFKTGAEDPLVCIYTSAGGTNPWSREAGNLFTQSLAYSNDRGRTWTKYAGNPVLPHVRGGNRDPKVIWHEPTGQWCIVLYLDEKEMGFYTSKDLKTWTETSRLKCFHECPELFELPVDGDKAKTRWILYGASGDYLIGEFDGATFKPDTEAIRFHHGDCFYASQTFNNMPDDRRVQIAWGQVPAPGMPFNQMMLFPVELTLRTTPDGLRMQAYPIREIRDLRGQRTLVTNETIQAGDNPLKALRGDCFDINALIEVGDSDFGFRLRGHQLIYRVDTHTLTYGNRSAQVLPRQGQIRLRLLVDRTSMEIFANQGEVYMPMRCLPDEADTREIAFFSEGPVTVQRMAVFELKSIWP